MNEFSFLTVTKEGGNPVIRRKSAAEVITESASPVIGAASGGMAVFSDAAGERVLRSVKVNVEPVQEGSGVPSLDNVRPITGWTGAKVTRTGKNLIPNLKRVVNAYNVTIGQTTPHSLGWEIHLTPGTYILSATLTISAYLHYRNKDNTISGHGAAGMNPTMQFTVSNTDDFAFWVYTNGGIVPDDIVSFQLERGSAATEYEPYAGEVINVAFPSEAGTVYSGVLDVTAGTLTVDRLMFSANTATMNNSESYPGWKNAGIRQFGPVNGQNTNALMNIGKVYGVNAANDAMFLPVATYGKTQTEWKALAQDVQILYTLVTPITYPLTPQQIAALAGINTVLADCGPVEVEYVQDTDAAIADTRAMVGEASGATASRSLAVGEYVTVGDKLYKVTSAVGAGETLVPGSNVTETTVGAELSRLSAMIAPR